MSAHRRWGWAALLLFVGCGTIDSPRGLDGGSDRPNVIWISLDATRADALGAWRDESRWGRDLPEAERPVAQTPTLDRLASEGVVFELAIAPATTSLSSQTSAFSGLDTHGHQVVRNGFPVPEHVQTVPEVLAASGWDTRAVVGASVLAPEMGLARGFGSYRGPEAERMKPPQYRLDAAAVTGLALEHGAAHDPSAGPLFLFAHYYDPHMPWTDAPDAVVEALSVPGYEGGVDGTWASLEALQRARRAGTLTPLDRRQARARYLAEVTAIDRQLERLLDGLKQQGLLDHAIVIVMATHGQALDEHPVLPWTRGSDVSLVDIHVPMVITGFGSVEVPAGVTVGSPVGLVDLPATLYALLGISAQTGVGLDLSPSWEGGSIPDRALFSEASMPAHREQATGWNNLPMARSVVGNGPDAPLQLLVRPLAGGARELNHAVPGAPALVRPSAPIRAAARTLLDRLQAWDAAAPAHRPQPDDEDTQRALNVLGYGMSDAPARSSEP